MSDKYKVGDIIVNIWPLYLAYNKKPRINVLIDIVLTVNQQDETVVLKYFDQLYKEGDLDNILTVKDQSGKLASGYSGDFAYGNLRESSDFCHQFKIQTPPIVSCPIDIASEIELVYLTAARENIP